MEARVAALGASTQRIEAAVTRISADVAATLQEMSDVRREVGDARRDMTDLRKEQVEQGKALARLDGRVTNLPTAIQMILFVLAVFAFGLGRQFWGG